MPKERLSMRRIKDLLRLKFQQRLSHRQIAASLGLSVSSVPPRPMSPGLTPRPSPRAIWKHYSSLRPRPVLRKAFPCALLVLDDWGAAPFTPEQRRDMLEILDERYGRHSTLVAAQVPVGQWHEVIADPTGADAIRDRLVRNAHRIEMKGESMCKVHGGLTKPEREPS